MRFSTALAALAALAVPSAASTLGQPQSGGGGLVARQGTGYVCPAAPTWDGRSPGGQHGVPGIYGVHNTSLTDPCHYMQALQLLITRASNETWLNEVTQCNQTDITAILFKATVAKNLLAVMQKNTTLPPICDRVYASDHDISSCTEMQTLQRMQHEAANITLLGIIFRNNQSLISEYEAKAAASAPELAAMVQNTTLTTFCSVHHTIQQCRAIKYLQAGHEGTPGGAAALQRLMHNATLIDLCPSLVPGWNVNDPVSNGQLQVVGGMLNAAPRTGGGSGAVGAIAAGLIAVAAGLLSL